MDISILTSSEEHPIFKCLKCWLKQQNKIGHHVHLTTDITSLDAGDFLFLVSCSTFVPLDVRRKFSFVLTVHASDLPDGRGWSPHVWQILNGANEITVSLIEAEDEIDTGAIWLQDILNFEGHELWDEINEALFNSTTKLMSDALKNHKDIVPKPQSSTGVTYFERRDPDDSRINPSETILSQFNMLRVCDPERFPAFFEHLGQRYNIVIKKIKN
jgi:methionyl-tRNA formyltransferase